MGFTDQFTASYRWRMTNGSGAVSGLEHLHVNSCENNIIASSALIGERGAVAYGIHYTIVCSPDWAVRSFSVENTDGKSLSMTSDGEGSWFNHDGSVLTRFTGAIDIDLSGTPFTNTLPIRRMAKHVPGNSQRFKIVYVALDTLEPAIDKQQYTCIVPYRIYRYEALGRDFSAELEVDKNGVVVDYPDLFTREKITVEHFEEDR